MSDLPQRWSDNFSGHALSSQWVGGHAGTSREARIDVADGLRISFIEGREYASAGVVTREGLVGDFDARVHFTSTAAAPGLALELAAIGIDPPRESMLDQARANKYTRSLVYDVHGASPYVSSEYDEGDGWRIAWNRGPASIRRSAENLPMSDNHFNRYGPSVAPAVERPVTGWLRLVRQQSDWLSYRLDDAGQWVLVGQVRHMNLPDAIFLRVAAKHWVKEGGAAPANEVVLTQFELRTAGAISSAPAANAASANALVTDPKEVALVRALRGCRKCAAFTTENLYGPFAQVVPNESTGRATVRGFAAPEPAPLYGCRKAPVMLIGINPNLPGHFILPREKEDDAWRSGSYRLLPYFESDAAYAWHYRFGPTPALEAEGAADLDHLLRQDPTLLLATKAGSIVAINEKVPAQGSERAIGRRAARLLLRDLDGNVDLHDLTWEQHESYVIVRRHFKAGEIIGGRMDASVVGRSVRVRQAPGIDDYYVHAGELLHHVGLAQYPGAKLQLGEDMSLHDAVACASPLWNRAEMPLDLIRDQCVQSAGWLHKQIEQSDPAVIVLAGRTALNLFAAARTGVFEPPLDELPSVAGGKDGLYATVAGKGLFWRWRPAADQPERRVRIVIAPHLSYDDNVRTHSYFSASEWREFCVAHEALAGRLMEVGRAAKVYDSDDMQVFWNEKLDLEPVIPAAWDALRERRINPYEMLAGAVAEGLRVANVTLDPHGNFRRRAETCSFCDNAQWRFEGGCRYKNTVG